MLLSQRTLIDIPPDVCYLNVASYSPLPLKTLDAGANAVAHRGRRWLIDGEFARCNTDYTAQKRGGTSYGRTGIVRPVTNS